MKPTFAGTSFSEKITNQPNAESGFWFSRDNSTLKPGFNLVLRLDERLKIDESRTVVLLGLSGGVAFNIRGDFGLRGKISISVSICGYLSASEHSGETGISGRDW